MGLEERRCKMKDTVNALNTKGKVAKCGAPDGDYPWRATAWEISFTPPTPLSAPSFDHFIQRFPFRTGLCLMYRVPGACKVSGLVAIE